MGYNVGISSPSIHYTLAIHHMENGVYYFGGHGEHNPRCPLWVSADTPALNLVSWLTAGTQRAKHLAQALTPGKKRTVCSGMQKQLKG